MLFYFLEVVFRVIKTDVISVLSLIWQRLYSLVGMCSNLEDSLR